MINEAASTRKRKRNTAGIGFRVCFIFIFLLVANLTPQWHQLSNEEPGPALLTFSELGIFNLELSTGDKDALSRPMGLPTRPPSPVPGMEPGK
jgi:hypothetical protein